MSGQSKFSPRVVGRGKDAKLPLISVLNRARRHDQRGPLSPDATNRDITVLSFNTGDGGLGGVGVAGEFGRLTICPSGTIRFYTDYSGKASMIDRFVVTYPVRSPGSRFPRYQTELLSFACQEGAANLLDDEEAEWKRHLQSRPISWAS